jgi:hypothetical protein
MQKIFSNKLDYMNDEYYFIGDIGNNSGNRTDLKFFRIPKMAMGNFTMDDVDTISFHYQDQYNNLIFRYDNAQHKPDLGYSEHKHIRDKIMPSKIPEIEQVILEIINEYLEI